MLTLLAAAVLTQQKMPDTSLRLKVGDSWTTEYSYHFTGEEIDQIQNETVAYSVVREGKRDVLVAQWKLKETKFDGETVPAPPGIKPVVRKITLAGEELTSFLNEDVARHRIERAIQIERKGKLTEPTFFPAPENARLVGLNRIVELDPRVKEESVLAAAVEEKGGGKPMRALGYYSFHPSSGILKMAHWTIVNCPIPGGGKMCELEITVESKNIKLAPRQ